MGLEIIEKISHKYGGDSNFVLAGGGNTSYKDENHLYIKGSGTALATITVDGFVKMSREALANIWTKTYSADKDKREADVLSDMMASKCDGEESKRPSVETLLHNLFSQPYVLHVHPAIVNGLTCSQDGEYAMKNMFPNAIWVCETEPGYILASKCRALINEYESSNSKKANLLFLQNHGIFFAADNEEEMDELVSSVMSEFNKKVRTKPDFSACKYDEDKANKVKNAFEIAYEGAFVSFTYNKTIKDLCKSKEAFDMLLRPFTPDHIVYCKAVPMFSENISCQNCAKRAINEFTKKNGFAPKVVFVKDVGMLTIGKNEKDVQTVADVWLDAIKIYVYSQNFGGPRYMAPTMVDFIANWEVENYRSQVALKNK